MLFLKNLLILIMLSTLSGIALGAAQPKILVFAPSDLSDTVKYPSSYIYREIIFKDIYDILIKKGGYDIPAELYLETLSKNALTPAAAALKEGANAVIYGDYKFSGVPGALAISINILILEYPSGKISSFSYEAPADIKMFSSIDRIIGDVAGTIELIKPKEIKPSEAVAAPLPLSGEFKPDLSASPPVKKKGFPVMIGFNLAAGAAWGNYSIDNTSDLGLINPNYSSAAGEIKETATTEPVYFSSAEFFLDLKYVRLDIAGGFSPATPDIVNANYSFNITSPLITSFSGTADSTNYSQTITFAVGILLKYPIDLPDGSDVWPGAGIDYHYTLFNENNGVNTLTNDYENRSSWWVKAGLGGDIKLSDNFYLTPSIIISYDLTAINYIDTPAFRQAYGVSLSDYLKDMDIQAYEWTLTFSIGAAYCF